MIAEGGFGTVYLAIQVGLNRQVALKVLQPRHVDDTEAKEQFIAEARMAARMTHPAIVPVLDHGIDEGTAYIAFPFIRGLSLERLIDFRRLPWTEAIAHGERLAQGLQAIHDAGIVHRDLKPANVLINEVGEAMLTDFGLAKSIDSAPVRYEGVVMGTAGYIAPERFRGDPDLPANDLYSLGVLLFEMLAGFRPFERENPADPLTIRDAKVEIKVSCSNPPPPLPECDPEVPVELADLVQRLLASDPRQRPRSADAVAKELARIAVLSGRRSAVEAASAAEPITPVAQRPSVWDKIRASTKAQPPPPPKRPPARRPALAMALASVVAAACAFVVGPWTAGWKPGAASETSPFRWLVPNSLPSYYDWSTRTALRSVIQSAGNRRISLTPMLREHGHFLCPLVVTSPAALAGTRLELSADAHLVGIDDPAAGVLETDSTHWQDGLRPGLNWLVVDAGPDGGSMKLDLPPTPEPEEQRDDQPLDAALWNQSEIVSCGAVGWTARCVAAAQERFSREQPYATRSAARALETFLQFQKEHGGEQGLQVSSARGPVTNPDGPCSWTMPNSTRLSLDEAQQAVDMDPVCWSAWHVLGVMLFHARQWDAARIALTRAVSLWPSSYWSWLALSHLEKVLAERESAQNEVSARGIHARLSLEYLGWARHYLAQLPQTAAVQSLMSELDSEHAHRSGLRAE